MPNHITSGVCYAKWVVHITQASFPLGILPTCLCSGIYVFTHHPLRVHSFILHVSPKCWTRLSPGDTLAGLRVEGWEVHRQSASCGVRKTLHFQIYSLKEPTSRRLVFLILPRKLQMLVSNGSSHLEPGCQ